MEFRKLKNKDGQALTRKSDGKELEELRFQPGDEFIPMFNTVLETTRDVMVKGVSKKITNYSIKVRARDSEGKVIKVDDSDEVFVTLTPAQANSLKKKAQEGVELTQNLFSAYAYDSTDYGTQIGLGLKKAHKTPKTFEELANEE